MKKFLFLIFFPTLLFSSVAKSSEEICSKYSNTIWEGEKKGKAFGQDLEGPISIKFKGKCSKVPFSKDYQIKYDWEGQNKYSKNWKAGTLRFKNDGSMTFNHSSGCKGKVKLDNSNNLIWQDVYSANRYIINVSNKEEERKRKELAQKVEEEKQRKQSSRLGA